MVYPPLESDHMFKHEVTVETLFSIGVDPELADYVTALYIKHYPKGDAIAYLELFDMLIVILEPSEDNHVVTLEDLLMATDDPNKLQLIRTIIA